MIEKYGLIEDKDACPACNGTGGDLKQPCKHCGGVGKRQFPRRHSDAQTRSKPRGSGGSVVILGGSGDGDVAQRETSNTNQARGKK